jgi:hypothetical protein
MAKKYIEDPNDLFSVRILKRELWAINNQIERFKSRGGNVAQFQSDIKKMNAIARALERDIEFLQKYRFYLDAPHNYEEEQLGNPIK